MKYNELEVKQDIIKAVLEMGFEDLTKIQEEAIPPACLGQDILGQAQTGTGKTASFVIPVLDQIDFDNPNIQAIMLAPTRELALQIKTEIEKIGKYMNVKAVAVYGGDSIDRQLKLLKDKPQIVVGTPGRTLDLLKRKKLKLSEIKYFVLDEVDEMLNMGFLEDVEVILGHMPSQRQTLLFSATLPERIKKIANKFLTNPLHIKVAAKSMTVEKVHQSYMIVKHNQKMSVLEDILLLRQNEKVIVFAQTKNMCDEVYDYLKERKFRVGKIHGDIVQKTRTMTIEQFRKNKFEVLIATDVVARGIDIDNVSLVVNLELPQDREYYIHRIGRTARGNSAKGEAITLVTPNTYKREFRLYPKFLNCEIHEMQRPSQNDIMAKLAAKYFMQVEENIGKKELSEEYYKLSTSLLAENSENVLVPYLLSLLYPELRPKSKKETEAATLSGSESSGRGRGGRGNGGGRPGGAGRGRPSGRPSSGGPRGNGGRGDSNAKYRKDKADGKPRNGRRKIMDK